MIKLLIRSSLWEVAPVAVPIKQLLSMTTVLVHSVIKKLVSGWERSFEMAVFFQTTWLKKGPIMN